MAGFIDKLIGNPAILRFCNPPMSRFLCSTTSTVTSSRRPSSAPSEATPPSAALAWDPPGTADALADRWVAELDRSGVSRAALIASVPGDAASVGAAVRRHRSRFVGLLHGRSDAAGRRRNRGGGARHARSARRSVSFRRCTASRFRTSGCSACSKSRPSVQAPWCSSTAACSRSASARCWDCRARSISASATRSISTRSRFPIRWCQIIVPHFGAGLFREALMLADLCPNIVLRHVELEQLDQLPARAHPQRRIQAALAVVGPDRLLFGSDSSFFPRGWVRDVYEQQSAVLDELGAGSEVREKMFGGNFERMFRERTA